MPSRSRLHFSDETVADQLQGLVKGMRRRHEILRDEVTKFVDGPGEMEPRYKPGDHSRSRTVCFALADTIVNSLGQVVETLSGLRDLRPEAQTVIDRFALDIERWRNMRDDVAHRFDRVFREQRPASNDAFVSGCQGYWAAHYDLARDTIGTGRSAFPRQQDHDNRINLAEALDRAQACANEACAAIGYDYEAKIATLCAIDI